MATILLISRGFRNFPASVREWRGFVPVISPALHVACTPFDASSVRCRRIRAGIARIDVLRCAFGSGDDTRNSGTGDGIRSIHPKWRQSDEHRFH